MICHIATHTHAHTWRSCPTEVSIPHDELSWPSTLPTLCFPHCSSVTAILSNSRTLDGYPLRQQLSIGIVVLGIGAQDLVSKFRVNYYLYKYSIFNNKGIVQVRNPACTTCLPTGRLESLQGQAAALRATIVVIQKPEAPPGPALLLLSLLTRPGTISFGVCSSPFSSCSCWDTCRGWIQGRVGSTDPRMA